VLDAALGQRIVIARRSGQDWYVAGINGSAPREISVPLGFLEGGNWNIEIIRDAGDSDEYPEHFVQESYTLKSNSLLLKLASGGGFAAIMTKQN
jgi:alpha-glucosidase